MMVTNLVHLPYLSVHSECNSKESLGDMMLVQGEPNKIKRLLNRFHKKINNFLSKA